MPTDPLAVAASVLEKCAELRAAGKHEVARALRIEVTRDDPALFALIYLTRHLRAENGQVSLSEVHKDWTAVAAEWIQPGMQRDAIIAPRSMGKSTWFFLILPMWAAAHGHARFVAAFANSAGQAQSHLLTFKRELDGNRLLGEDYPHISQPMMRRGRPIADSQDTYIAEGGFAFVARGADTGNLGLKIDDARPDLIICDDLEPGEGSYSAYQAQQRLTTLLDDILPLNFKAKTAIIGTTVMSGSIVDQLRRHAVGDKGDVPPADDWVTNERFRVHYYVPIVTDPDGERRSVWPEKWSLEFLQSIEHTRSYAKNYLSSPLGADGDYWTMDDFIPMTAELDAMITHEVIEIDPAVTTKESSDFTAIASVGWSREAGRCLVYEARQYKVGPDEIRLAVLRHVERALERGHVVIVRIEANQGGDLWKRILHNLPVKVITHPAGTASKHVRAADALDHYNRRRVEHAPGLREAEGQMVAFPKAPHDDLVDAVGAGVRYFLSRGNKRKITPGSTSVAYA